MIVFERFDDADGKPRVHIKGRNGEILMVSEAYESDESREDVIHLVINSCVSGNYNITTK